MKYAGNWTITKLKKLIILRVNQSEPNLPMPSNALNPTKNSTMAMSSRQEANHCKRGVVATITSWRKRCIRIGASDLALKTARRQI